MGTIMTITTLRGSLSKKERQNKLSFPSMPTSIRLKSSKFTMFVQDVAMMMILMSFSNTTVMIDASEAVEVKRTNNISSREPTSSMLNSEMVLAALPENFGSQRTKPLPFFTFDKTQKLLIN